MDRDSYILHIHTKDFYKDIDNDVNEWCDTSDCKEKLNRPLPKEINKKVIGKFKDELNWMSMTEFCAPRAKTYASKYEEDDKIKEKKKAKATKMCDKE